jgi:hypothetical protein
MILLPGQWHDFYTGVKEDKHTTSEKRVSIFCCGTDCDSLCALKVLQVSTRAPAALAFQGLMLQMLCVRCT